MLSVISLWGFPLKSLINSINIKIRQIIGIQVLSVTQSSKVCTKLLLLIISTHVALVISAQKKKRLTISVINIVPQPGWRSGCESLRWEGGSQASAARWGGRLADIAAPPVTGGWQACFCLSFRAQKSAASGPWSPFLVLAPDQLPPVQGRWQCGPSIAPLGACWRARAT